MGLFKLHLPLQEEADQNSVEYKMGQSWSIFNCIALRDIFVDI